MSNSNEYGLVSIHWALGGLVLIGLSASEYTGAGTVVSLPIAAAGATLSAISGLNYAPVKTTKKSCTGFVHFLVIWLNILELLMAVAACARVASATIDYTSEEQLRMWLLGIESHSLGEPWPDVLGITIIAVVMILFMLGLEASSFLRFLLYAVLVFGFLFFTIVGSYLIDVKFWSWTEDFMKRSWGQVLTATALCYYAFANTFFHTNSKRRFKMSGLVIVPLTCYCLMTLIFTLMSYYREIAGIAISLVRVFEVREVLWARLCMALCTICVVCLALTEVVPSLYEAIADLAKPEWNILTSIILYESPLTGAPLLAIFISGSLSSILAFACPLFYLVRLLNTSSLLKCALRSSIVLYLCYKSKVQSKKFVDCSSNIQYNKLKSDSQLKVQPKRSMMSHFTWPNNLSKAGRRKIPKARKDTTEDKEYLLLGQYSNNSLENFETHNYSSSEGSDIEITSPANEAGESSSSTDIDAAVQEYKDRVKVISSKNFHSSSIRCVFPDKVIFLIILVLFGASALLSASVSSNQAHLVYLSVIIICLCLAIISVMPQEFEDRDSQTVLSNSTPYTSMFAIVLNVLLATVLLPDIWPGVVFWVISGIMLFLRFGCCYCDEAKENILHPDTLTNPFMSRSSSEEKIVSTVVIPR